MNEVRKMYALQGLKVLDFTWVVAGPICGAYLADFGAQVIKLESRIHPDLCRLSSPYKDDKVDLDHSIAFPVFNNGKRSLTLNLGHPRGIEVAKMLVAWSDVVIENFGPGGMERWGLDYNELKKVKSDVILVSISNQGQTGPLSSFKGWGIHAAGATGLYHITGWEDREPTAPPDVYPDVVTPVISLCAIMAALDYRQRTGKGQYIDISQLEATLHSISPTILDYAVNRHEEIRCGNRSSYACPNNVYRCKGEDRWCVISISTDVDWDTLCRLMGNPGWTGKPEFSTLSGRKDNEDKLDELIGAWTSGYSPEELVRKLQKAGIAAGVVKRGEDLVYKDSQLKHRGYYSSVDHPTLGQYIVQGWPVKLSATPYAAGRAPLLGEDNEFVCTKILNLSGEDFASLINDGVVQ